MNYTSQEKIDLWRKLIADADSSGMSASEWCRQSNKTLKQLNYWRHRIEDLSEGRLSEPSKDDRRTEHVSLDKETGKFIEMSIAEDMNEDFCPHNPVKSLNRSVSRYTDPQPEIRIETSTFSIYVRNGVHEETLRMVLRVAANA